MMLVIALAMNLAAVAPPGTNYSCDDVRGYVATHGRVAAWAKALEMVATKQMTWAQLQAAQACMKVRKG